MTSVTNRRTEHQLLGELGEKTVVKFCACPRCKRGGTLKRLGTNFKAADVVCDFCGFTAQVKAVARTLGAGLPRFLLGASWPVQLERMESHIFLPLYIVLVADGKPQKVFYVPADLQTPAMFKSRNPLRETAKRAGWQGFVYDLSVLPPGVPVTLWESKRAARPVGPVQQQKLLEV